MKNAGKGSKTTVKAGQDTRKDRKSGTGMNGSPKKGGHGGKFTWAGDGYSDAELGQFHDAAAIDVKDPNYEDPIKAED
ncbi:OLC1v1037569C1 [Oldenlandia corymbosa var. corymbosa]|uniref:OLC1v1037569C1 n=1 Tax=Oldenlandia corymbosa var. corymbosa TaxID=529605 RepID=A0AAV1CXM8_OLDCO|nr:OLC1v1037569C1 [Oldenlandia corymbosa var. corymbosa]